MVGSNTALQDDPELTCRLPGLPERPSVRIVLDGRLRLGLTARIVATARDIPPSNVTRAAVAPILPRAFEACALGALAVKTADAGYPATRRALGRPAERGSPP